MTSIPGTPAVRTRRCAHRDLREPSMLRKLQLHSRHEPTRWAPDRRLL